MKKTRLMQMVALMIGMTAFLARAQQPALGSDQSFAARLSAGSARIVSSFKPLPRLSAPAAKSVAAKTSLSGETVSGGGTVSGFGNFFCSPMNGVAGFMSGEVMLSGTVDVSGPEGVHGSIPVSGTILMSGQCRYGSGNVSGMGSVSGSGTVYGADGRPAGTAQVSGTAIANAFVSSSMASLTQYVSVFGTVQ